MKKIAVLLSLLSIAACQKDHTVNMPSGVRVRYVDDSDYIPIQRINAQWDYIKGNAVLLADGYKGEAFLLNVAGISDTGTIPDPGINMIDYVDGKGAAPDAISGGYIHISAISRDAVSGEFRFSSSCNGGNSRLVIGGFNIQQPQMNN